MSHFFPSPRVAFSPRPAQSDPYLEVTAFNSRLSAAFIKEADCRGYLGKFSHLKKIWRQKYFVLKDAALYLFQEINSPNAQGKYSSSSAGRERERERDEEKVN